METITIQDVGPIVEHTLLVEPGVIVLTGGNEAGKSTAIACVAALSGRDVDVLIRDGAKKGVVKGFGTTLSIGARKSSRSGELEADAVEEKISLADLVDPGLKQAAAATRKRIKSLLSLTGQVLTIADFAPILPEGRAESEILAADYDEDPVEMAGKIKRRMEKKALAAEEKAKDLEVKMQAKSQSYAGVDLSAEHDATKLQDAYSKAIRSHESLQNELVAFKDACQATNEAKDKIRDAAEAIKKCGTLESEVLESANLLKRAADHQRTLEMEIEELKERLTAKEAELKAQIEIVAARDQALTAKHDAHEQASDHVETMRVAKAILEKPLPSPPSQDDIDGAADVVSQARQAIEQSARVRDAITAKADYKKLLDEFTVVSEEAELFRSAAGSTNEVLSSAVACETLKVIEGDLFYVEGERREPFARLSAGRRFQVAISEIARSVSAGKKRLAVLPLDQEAWDGMEAATRDIVDRIAEEKGIAIVTGQIRNEGGPLSSYRYKRNGK